MTPHFNGIPFVPWILVWSLHCCWGCLYKPIWSSAGLFWIDTQRCGAWVVIFPCEVFPCLKQPASCYFIAVFSKHGMFLFWLASPQIYSEPSTICGLYHFFLTHTLVWLPTYFYFVKSPVSTSCLQAISWNLSCFNLNFSRAYRVRRPSMMQNVTPYTECNDCQWGCRERVTNSRIEKGVRSVQLFGGEPLEVPPICV